MLINGKNDDIGAIINTAINEYNALMYIIGAVVLSAAFCYFLVKFLAWGTKKYSNYADTQLVCSTWYPKDEENTMDHRCWIDCSYRCIRSVL